MATAIAEPPHLTADLKALYLCRRSRRSGVP